MTRTKPTPSHRLIDRAELSRRVDCSRALVYKEARPKGALAAAVVDDKIDLNHPAAYAWCVAHGYQEPNGKELAAAVRQKAKAQAKPVYAAPAPRDSVLERLQTIVDERAAEEAIGDEETANDLLNLTVAEVVARFGTVSAFKDLTAAAKNLVQMRGYEEEQARKRGEFIHKSNAEQLVAMIDALAKALLTDAVTNMANKAVTQVRAGHDVAQIEQGMRETISRSIKSAKAQTARVLRDVR